MEVLSTGAGRTSVLGTSFRRSVNDTMATVENIEIKERLGGGNFGDVWRGLWNGQTEVALKSLKVEEKLQEFMREAKMLQ